MDEFKDKVVMITGASTGIGRATALSFAREGASLVLADVSDKEGHETLRLVEQAGAPAIYVHCDVRRSDDVRDLVQQCIDKLGRLDIAYNNAGVLGKQAQTTECSEENWDLIMGTNVKGIWLCMKHQIPWMLKQGSGSIVNCASVAGLVGFPGIPAYVASKHGIIGLTRTAALEYARAGIRINVVCPGAIETPMLAQSVGSSPEGWEQVAKSEPIGRIGRPGEIADAVLWLSSARSSFLTGHTLAVDGGWVAQ